MEFFLDVPEIFSGEDEKGSAVEVEGDVIASVVFLIQAVSNANVAFVLVVGIDDYEPSANLFDHVFHYNSF